MLLPLIRQASLTPTDPNDQGRVRADLHASPAHIPPKFFYDAQGCAIYSAICELAEYYPTRTEAAIFEAHRGNIASAIGAGRHMIDLGSADSIKAEAWLPHLDVARYSPIDIAEGAVQSALARLHRKFPALSMQGIVADFLNDLNLHAALLPDAPRLFFYPGSSIGNFAPDAALHFLRSIYQHCSVAGSGLLIGVDSVKDSARLQAAYADGLGITAAFNLNALRHLNRVIGSDFVEADFEHVAFFNAEASRIEMHLEAKRALRVNLGDGSVRAFRKSERILTEYSYKYTQMAFAELLVRAGFQTPTLWTDASEDFWVFYAPAA